MDIKNFQVSGESVTLRINEGIESNTAKNFIDQLDYVVSMGFKKVVVAINSEGGSVFAGLEIFEAIHSAPVETETRVTGIAASIAGVISQAGKKRTICDFAIFHAHAPYYPEGSADTESEKLLNNCYDSIANILQSYSKINNDEIADILSRETFFSSSEAMERGLFDEVITTGKNKPVISSGMSALEIRNAFESTINKVEMSKLNEVLGIQNEASEAVQLDAVNSLKEAAAKVEGLEAENSILKTKLEQADKAKAEALVDGAIEKGKVKKEARDSWVKNAVTDFEGTREMLEGVSSVSISNHIETGKDTDPTDPKANWDYSEWEQKDPEGLAAMRNENPKRFLKLQNAYLG